MFAMSIYTRCAQAVEELRADPPSEQGGVFTELDVVQMALEDSDDVREVLREASNLCGRLYRESRLCRYGPVVISIDGTEAQDYGRIATKIVYADADLGPNLWVTPNGSFPKLFLGSDGIAHQRGRRNGIKRNDLLPRNGGPVNEIDGLRVRIDRYERRIRALEDGIERRKAERA